ncbi:MAG: hypothetical protein IJR08_00190 [Bacilli bacterium]|nr:hypothetical protein [Bacilli bacterium]
MKKNLSKVIVPTLAIAIGAAIAGSISGTVAWYQYSTRVNVAYLGTSAGTSGNLFLRIKGTNPWLTNLSYSAIADYLQGKGIGQKVQPITSGNMGEDDDLPRVGGTGTDKYNPVFYQNPIQEKEYETSPYSRWLKADNSMYVTIPLELAYIEKDNKLSANNIDEEYLAKDVYLSDLLIQEDYSNNGNTDPLKDREDLSSAVRVHIRSYLDTDTSENHATSAINRLISKDGGTILTHGYLPLGDGIHDDSVTLGDDPGAMYDFGKDNETKKVVYGEGLQKSYSNGTAVKDGSYVDKDGLNPTAEKVYPTVVKSVLDANDKKTNVLDEDDFEYDTDSGSVSKKIGTTIAHKDGEDENAGKYLQVELTIWVEGWQKLLVKGSNPAEYKSIWDSDDYIGSKFNVGFQFAVQAE